MDSLERANKQVDAARAAYGELVRAMEELGDDVGTAGLRVYGIRESDLEPAAEKIFQIRKIAAASRALAEKNNLLASEKNELIGLATTFSSLASYLRHILGKKGDAARRNADDMRNYRTGESAKWTTVRNAAGDITVLLDLLEKGDAGYSPEKIGKLRNSTAVLVAEAKEEGHARDAALEALQAMLATLRKDALELQHQRERLTDEFPQM